MKATPTTFPVIVKRGSAQVRIYRVQPKKGTPYYQVADYSTGERRFRTFSDFTKAKKEATFIASGLAAGDPGLCALRSDDRAAYLRAMDLLSPTGVSLEVAVGEFAEACKILDGDRILDAARYYAKRNPISLPAIPVCEVVAELIEAKERDGMSARYLADLRSRLGKFQRAFRCNLASISGQMLQEFLDAIRLSPQSRLNYRRVLSLLFNFARRRGYLPKDWDELERLEIPRPRPQTVEIFTPQELRQLLAEATPDFRPSLAIAAFAGLRSAEIERLDWREVDLEAGWITVLPEKAKTASRRLAPIVKNLAAWLQPYVPAQGPVWPGSHDAFYDAQQATAAQAGIPWKQNALRHSFISYRLAYIKDENRVAHEAGNSPMSLK